MSGFIAGLKKVVVQALKAVAERVVNNVLVGGKEKRGKTLKILVVIMVTLMFLFNAVAELLLGPTIHVAEAFLNFFINSGYTQEEMDEIIGDAGKLAKFLDKYPEYTFTNQNSFLMDRKTIIRVLKAVDSYNKKMSDSKTILYEYRIEYSPHYYLEEIAEEWLPGQVSKVETTENDVQLEEGIIEEMAIVVNAWDSVELSTKGIDNDPDEVGEDIFYLNWQPILVLCSMCIQDNLDKIGTYNEVDEDGESYYLSNEQIDEIIALIAYDYTYYQDYCQTLATLLYYDYVNERPSGYRLEVSEEENSAFRIIKRIPAIAPKEIKNSYLSYTYTYELLPNGYHYLKERTCTVDATRFVTACEEIMPSFNGDLFVQKLSYLPQTMELVSYYRDFILKRARTGEIYTNTVTDPDICPSIGVMVSNPKNLSNDLFDEFIYGDSEIDWEAGAMEWDGQSHIVPLYAIDGWNQIYVRPGEWIVEEGNSYGSYAVYEDAMKSLTVSDGFTLEEITYLFQSGGFREKYANSPLFASEQAVKDTAQCFYDYQERTGTSICGLLGIMRQEGGFSSAITRNGWNYFNIKASGEQPKTSYTNASGVVKHTDFRNYKAEYESSGTGTYATAAVNALAAQMDWINRNYWQKGQNSYYLMVWNGYRTGDPEHAYESISHSYCPPWDDTAMPYSNDSYRIVGGEVKSYWTNASDFNKGWINRCAQYRYEYYTFVKSKN